MDRWAACNERFKKIRAIINCFQRPGHVLIKVPYQMGLVQANEITSNTELIHFYTPWKGTGEQNWLEGWT